MWNDGAMLCGVLMLIGFVTMLVTAPADQVSKKRNHKRYHYKSRID